MEIAEKGPWSNLRNSMGKTGFWRRLALFLGGIACTLVLLSLIWKDVYQIYQVQRELVVGSFFSLATFFFQRVMTQTEEEQIENKAVEKIRNLDEIPQEPPESNVPDYEIKKALYQKIKDYKRDSGLIHETALVKNNISGAYDRMSEFYDEVSDEPFFHDNRQFILVLLDEIDKVASNALKLRSIIKEDAEETLKSDRQRQKKDELTILERHITEALNRRDQAWEILAGERFRIKDYPDLLNLFRVMTSDLTKTQKTLTLLQSQGRANTEDEFVRLMNQIYEYLEASIQRGDEFINQFEGVAHGQNADMEEELPPVFSVMRGDIANAEKFLIQNFDIKDNED